MTTSSTTGADPVGSDSDRMVPIGHLVDVCASLRGYRVVGTGMTEATYRYHWPAAIERPDGYGGYFPLLVDTVKPEDQRGCVPLNTAEFQNNHADPMFPTGRPIWWYVAWVRPVGKGIPTVQQIKEITLRPGEEWLTVNEGRMLPMQYPQEMIGQNVYLLGSRPKRQQGKPYPILFWRGIAPSMQPWITTVAGRKPTYGRLALVRAGIVFPIYPKE